MRFLSDFFFSDEEQEITEEKNNQDLLLLYCGENIELYHSKEYLVK